MLELKEQNIRQGEELVREYLRTGNLSLKDNIVRSYTPLVKFIVGRFNLSYSTTLSKDDLYQFGTLGLLKALDKFDEKLNVPFKAYAYRRIHGEVIDAMRREGLIGRDMYDKVKKLEQCIRGMTSRNGREPAMAEVCDQMGITENEYYSVLNVSHITYMTSLNKTITDDEGASVYKVDTLMDDTQSTPEDVFIEKNLKEKIKKLVAELPERKRLILALYFYEELILADIAKILNLSEARISQILNKTLVELRARIQ